MKTWIKTKVHPKNQHDANIAVSLLTIAVFGVGSVFLGLTTF